VHAAARAIGEQRAFFNEVSPGEKVIPRVMTDDVIVVIAGAESVRQANEKPIVDRKRFRYPLARELETVRKKVVGVSAPVLSSKTSIRMNELARELDRASQRVF